MTTANPVDLFAAICAAASKRGEKAVTEAIDRFTDAHPDLPDGFWPAARKASVEAIARAHQTKQAERARRAKVAAAEKQQHQAEAEQKQAREAANTPDMIAARLFAKEARVPLEEAQRLQRANPAAFACALRNRCAAAYYRVAAKQ